MRYFLSFLFIITIGYHTASYAQYNASENKVWAFCNNVGLDFGSGAPALIKTGFASGRSAGASVCDAAGSLLFYTNGSIVWDRNGNPMSNGNPLYPTSYPTPYGSPTENTTQGALIVPVIGSSSKYYVLSLTDVDEYIVPPLHTYQGRLFYSIVDMSLNGGMGNVATGQNWTQIDTGLSEKMIAVPGNNCDIWIVVHSNSFNTFKSYHVTSAGIDLNPVLSTTGAIGYVPDNVPIDYINVFYSQGQMCVSPNGKKLAVVYRTGGCSELHDFDPATGKVSNSMVIDSMHGGYGVAFSPNSSKLYILGPGIAQFDLTVPTRAAITASKTRIVTNTNAVIGQLKLGPDGKIYFGSWEVGSHADTVSAIQHPDLAGIACGPAATNLIITDIPLSYSFGNTFVRPLSTGNDTIFNAAIDTLICGSLGTGLLLQPAAGGTGYLWSDGSTNPTLTVQQRGTYWVGHYDGCKYSVDSFIIRGSAGPTLQASAGQLICRGDSVAMTASGAASYQWSPAAGLSCSTCPNPITVPQQSTTYTVTGADSAGCTDKKQIIITVDEAKAQFTLNKDSLCLNDTLILQDQSIGSNLSYKWYFGDGDSATLQNPTHVYQQTGPKQVTLQINNTCKSSDTKPIYVYVTPNVLMSISAATGCVGNAFQITSNIDPEQARVHWDFGDGTEIDNAAGPAHAYGHEGTYVVTVATAYPGCPLVTRTDTVTVLPSPIVNIGPDTTLCPNDPPILLRNKNAMPAYKYRWSDSTAGIYTYAIVPGTYWLTVSNGTCSTTDSITVANSCYTRIPNAFTPNGDDINDYFFPREMLTRGLKAFHMQIFNRWGQLIYETNNTAGKGWDGSFNGTPQPGGVYIYQIEATFINNTTEKHQGNVTLIR